MNEKKLDESSTVVRDFGDDFGTLVMYDASQIFQDIYASTSPFDPIFNKAIEQDPYG